MNEEAIERQKDGGAECFVWLVLSYWVFFFLLSWEGRGALQEVEVDTEGLGDEWD